MSLNDIYDALNSEINQNTINLYEAASLSALSQLGTTLTRMGISSQYLLNNVSMNRTVSAVILTGSGIYNASNASDKSNDIQATLTATLDGDTFVFQLELAIQTHNWTFGDFFPALPPYQSFDSNTQVVDIVTPSFLADMILDNPVFYASSALENDTNDDDPIQQVVNLRGDLPDTSVLGNYRALLPNWPLQLSGTVEFGATEQDAPVLDLKAYTTGMEITFSANNSTKIQQFGFNILTVTGLSPEESPISDLAILNFVSNLYFGEALILISLQLLASYTFWRFTASIPDDPKFSIGNQINTIAKWLGLTTNDLIVPDNFPILSSFRISEFEVGFDIPRNDFDLKKFGVLDHVAVTIASSKLWNPPIPFVRVTDIGTRWMIGFLPSIDGSRTQFTSGSVFGSLVIGDDQNSFSLDVIALIPQYVVKGSLRNDDTIPIGTAFKHFFGAEGPATSDDKQLEITAFDFEADPRLKTFDGSAEVTTPWTINFNNNVSLHLLNLYFNISVSQAAVNGGITGILELTGAGDNPVQFMIGAQFAQANEQSGWRFVAALSPYSSLNLTVLVSNLLGVDLSGLPSLTIDSMSLSFDTQSEAYSAYGVISSRWELEVFKIKLTLSASAIVDVNRPDKDSNVQGRLEGIFAVNRIGLQVARDIGVTEPTMEFKIFFGDIWLSAVTSWRGNSGERHQVITIQLGGITLGGILEYLVNLAAPAIGFHLDPPWDILNKVDLSSFHLTIDPQKNIVEFTYEASINLVVMSITNIGVRYNKESGESKVNLILEGSFLGEDYSGDNALAWDVISDPPPAVPGQNETLIDLRYLGIGQHVTLSNVESLYTVRETLTALREAMQPVKDPDKNPLSQNSSSMIFDADSEWIIGLDVGLMDTVDIGVIFNDPYLYGLYIALGGEKAGSLSGLYFEILYKKITDTIGMFRIELHLPEAFRHIELGEVSITLGVIVVEIYTNGNFMIDLGFPYNRNFERSFTVEVFPFLGRGGIYFGLLDGNTSRRVPTISNGTFAPVLELGIGLAVGVGKDIEIGPLSGGIYVEVEVIFQGVLAWFNPADSSKSSEIYYWCQGIVALHGKVYGAIDFKVIKVSVTLDVYASVSAIFEAYQPTIFRLHAEVKAEASVKVLFIKVSFSFKTELDLSFTVGKEETPPWIVTAPAPQSLPPDKSSNIHPGNLRNIEKRSVAMRGNHARNFASMAFVAMASPSNMLGEKDEPPVRIADTNLNWNPNAPIFTDVPRDIPLKMMPVFSATDIPMTWDNTPPDNTHPEYRVAMLLFADTGVSPQAQAHHETHLLSSDLSAHAVDIEQLPASMLMDSFLRWAIYAITNPQNGTAASFVTFGQLTELLNQMGLESTIDTGFAYDNLDAFFTQNIKLKVSGIPSGEPSEISAMPFPMPPAMTMSWVVPGDEEGEEKTTNQVTQSRNFATWNEINARYEDTVNKYFAKFFPIDLPDSRNSSDSATESTESFSSYFFRDTFLMLTKALVQIAIDLMKSWEYTTPSFSTETVSSQLSYQVDYMVGAGDTVQSVAAVVGASIEELEFLNENLAQTLQSATVGDVIAITLITTSSLKAIADTFQQHTIQYAVRAGDTVQSVAAVVGASIEELEFLNERLAQTLQSATVGDVIAINLGVAPQILVIDNPKITLSPGTFDMGNYSYQVTDTDTLTAIVTLFDTTTTALFAQDSTLADSRQLLRYDAELQVPERVYDTSMSVLRTAAIFYVRYYNPELPYENWYAQTVAQRNDDALQDYDPSAEIPAGLSLDIPASLFSTDNATQPYISVTGDNLTQIGKALSLEQNFSSTAPDSAPSWTNFRDNVQSPESGKITIPSTSTYILAGETVNLLADRLITYSRPADQSDTDNILDLIADANILNALTGITIDNLQVNTQTHRTFAAIADAFSLSLAEVGQRLATAPNLIPANEVLTVVYLPVQEVDTLIRKVLTSSGASNTTGSIARQMMAGLRLPDPSINSDDEVPIEETDLVALYELTGQQFVGPIPKLNSDPDINNLEITMMTNSGTSWIELVDSTTVQTNETLRTLLERHPEVAKHNAYLAYLSQDAEDESTNLPEGLIVLTDELNELTYSYTAEQLANQYPEPALAVHPLISPRAIPLISDVPITYGLDHHVELQTPFDLKIPKPDVQETSIGNSGLWYFPDSLIVKALAQTSTAYEIVRSDHHVSQANDAADVILNSTFATLIPVNVHNLSNQSKVYDLRGIDSSTHDALLALWQFLKADGNSSDEAQLVLLMNPAPDVTNPSGLKAVAIDSANTYVMKTNLSTATVPNIEDSIDRFDVFLAENALDEPEDNEDQQVFFANVTDIAELLMLLWEGSAIGGEGYYIGVSDDNGEGLPNSIFDQRGNATISLLIIVKSQQGLATNGRQLLKFNNCALVGAGLDASAHSIYVEAYMDSSKTTGEIPADELKPMPTVPPGKVGFTATLPRPDDKDTEATNTLFSLMNYKVGAENDVFYASEMALPITPHADDASNYDENKERLLQWQKHRIMREKAIAGKLAAHEPQGGANTLEEASTHWHYQSVLPIATMGPKSLLPAIIGLPNPITDPYRGIVGQAAIQSAHLKLGMSDILGNVTSDADDFALDLEVAYTDNLMTINNWSAITVNYNFEQVESTNDVNIVLNLGIQVSSFMPDLTVSPDTIANKATKSAQRYSTVYYQLGDSQISWSLLSSLKVDANGNQVPILLEGANNQLWSFIAGAYAYAKSVSQLEPVLPFKDASNNLSYVTETYSYEADMLASANTNISVRALLGAQSVPMPALITFTEQASASSIAANHPTITAEQILTLPENADQLPLRVGSILTIPTKTFTVTDTGKTFADIASTQFTTVGLLAIDNADNNTILKTGFVFTIDNTSVTVDPDSNIQTFTQIADAFQIRGIQVTAAEIATDYADATDVFNDNAVLQNTKYIVPVSENDQHETLQNNQSGATVEQLASNNTNTVNIFESGALIHLGDFANNPVIDSDNDETLLQFCNRYNCPPTIFLDYLSIKNTQFPQGSALQVPGTLTMPADHALLRVPYYILEGDLLSEIVKKFDYSNEGSQSAITQLMTDNAVMPDTLLPDKTITVQLTSNNSYSVVTVAGDGFGSVLSRLQNQNSAISMNDLALSIGSQQQLLKQDTLLICRAAKLFNRDAQGEALSPDQINSLYGVSSVSFAQSNLALEGLLASNVSLNGPNDTRVETEANDTLNTTLACFHAKGQDTDLATIIAMNHNVQIFQSGALALLPPKSVIFSVPFEASTGTYDRVAFPLQVALKMQRPETLVPESYRTTSIAVASTTVLPPVSPNPTSQDQFLSLQQFAKDFEKIFPLLRLGTGRIAGHSDDLWVIDFSSSGIESVTVEAGVSLPGEGTPIYIPRYFSIRPLFNDLINLSQVQLKIVKEDGTLENAPEKTDFQSVDIEVWAERFLSDVERFLSLPYATGMYATQANQLDLRNVIIAKQNLLTGIANGLYPVLELEESIEGETVLEVARQSAIDSLKQQLGANLETAYQINTVVQYDASVVANNLLGQATRLYGDPIDIGADTAKNSKFTFTNAKTQLDKPKSYVNFMLTVSDDKNADVNVDLDYEYTHLEYDIQKIQIDPETSYDASSWITFVPKIDEDNRPDKVNTKLKKADIPIPLRSYPETPIIRDQQARSTASSDETVTLDDAAEWNYRFKYTHEHTEQDEVIVTATYNIQSQANDANHDTLALETISDLSSALAVYNSTADALWNLMNFYTDPTTGDSETAKNATHGLATLITSVAEAWYAYWDQVDKPDQAINMLLETQTASAPAEKTYEFVVRIHYNDDDQITNITLSTEDENVLWPDVIYQAPDGKLYLPDSVTHNSDTKRTYNFDKAIPASSYVGIILEWKKLNVSDYQNARGSVTVKRNEYLFEDEQLSQIKTSTPFIFQSPTIDAPTIVTPFNDYKHIFALQGVGFVEALDTMFTSLFPNNSGDGLPIMMELFYGYEIISGSGGQNQSLITHLPIALYPHQIKSSTTSNDIYQTLTAWQTSNQPNREGGHWVLSLTVYSQMSRNDDSQLPLLNLGEITYSIV